MPGATRKKCHACGKLADFRIVDWLEPKAELRLCVVDARWLLLTLGLRVEEFAFKGKKG